MASSSSSGKKPRRWWTEDEDQILRQEAELQLNEGALNDWSRIAQKLPERTNKDCRKRWSKICENIKKGAWSEEEDQRLRHAVANFGTRWTQVAQYVQTRHGDQCAKRWQHSLDPSLDHSQWKAEDDERLISAVLVNGRNWKKIGEMEFPGRSVTDIKNRHATLERRQKQSTGTSSTRQGQPSSSRDMARRDSAQEQSEDTESTEDTSEADMEEEQVESVYGSYQNYVPQPGLGAGSSHMNSFGGTGAEAGMSSDQHMDFSYMSGNQYMDASLLNHPNPQQTQQQQFMPHPASASSSKHHLHSLHPPPSHHGFGHAPSPADQIAWDTSPTAMMNQYGGMQPYPQTQGGPGDLLTSGGGGSAPTHEGSNKSTLVLEDVEPDTVKQILDMLATTRNNVKIKIYTQQG